MQLELNSNSIEKNEMQINAKGILKKFLWFWCWKKETLKRNRLEKIIFHSSLFKNWLKGFQFGMI
jgi:hypothetical protein